MDSASTDRSETASGMPSHRVPLTGGWHLWRTICLRGTGFPVSLLDPFGGHEAAAAVDALFAAEAVEKKARNEAERACMAGRRAAPKGMRAEWNRASRRIAKGRIPAATAKLASLMPLLERMSHAADERAAAYERAGQIIGEAEDGEWQALRAAARDPRFTEALIWQNRSALTNALRPFAEEGTFGRDSRGRQAARLALTYLQRYVAKNESIGFFGPIGWGSFMARGPAVVLRPGPALVSERIVEFEPWAIREIAAALSREPKLRPWLAPRLNPLMRLDGGTLCDGAGRHHPLTPPLFRLLSGCDGAATAADIAARLVATPGAGFADAPQVFQALSQLARRGVLIWRLDVPVGPFPERALAGALACIGDEALRRSLEARLAELVAARDRLGSASGNPEMLNAAFADFEARFAQATGRSAAGRSRASPVGRALAYEDCRRDAELKMGPEIVAALGPPLALVLASARWFTDAGSERVMAQVAELFARFRRDAGTKAPDFAPFWKVVAERGVVSDANLVPIARELQARWAKILPLDSADRRAAFTAASLGPRVAEAFLARPLPFPRILHHAPDVMIAAKSAEAICRGDYRFILGEVHAGYATQSQPLFARLHPRPRDLVDAWEYDVGRRSFVFPTLPSPERRTRYSDSDRVFELACNEGLPRRRHGRVIALSDLVAEETADGLTVRTRDGRHRFHILDVFAFVMVGWSTRCFSMFAATPHSPRIAIDNFIVKRESWRFGCGEVSFAAEKTGAARFVAARRWARAHDLPRRVFIRFPQEQKPVYIDLESPAFVDLAAHLWRAAAAKHADGFVSVTEMLPGPEDCWLVDAQGNRYTSELRLVAVDPAVSR